MQSQTPRIILLGLVFILITTSFVMAITSDVSDMGAMASSAGPNTAMTGHKFQTTYTDANTITVWKEATDGSDGCSLYDGATENLLATGTYEANETCSISYNLTAGTDYYVVSTASGNRNYRYNAAESYPYTSTGGYISITHRAYNSGVWTIDTSNRVSITKIEIINGSAPVDTDSDFTLINIYNSTAITDFTIEIDNGSILQNITTTNGSVIWPKGQTANISIFDIVGNTYFNQTVYNWNTSEDYEAQTWQAELYIYAIQNYTSAVIENFNLSIGTLFNTSNDNYTIFYIDSGTWNYTARAKDHNYNSTGNFTVSPNDVLNSTIGFIPFAINISAKEFFSNNTINGFTLQVLSDFYNMNYSATAGSILIYGVNGTYNLTAITANYSDQSILFNMSADGLNHTFYLYTTNSIYFNIYDDITGVFVDSQIVDLELISTPFSDNYSTTNGTIYVDLLSPSSYTIRTKSEGYATNFYEYTLTDNTNKIIDIYLLLANTTNYKQITGTVYDQNRREVENAVVKLLRYDIDTNSYVLRQIVRTNFEGQTLLEVVKYEEYYKFIIEYAGVQKLETTKSQIFEDSITFQISIGDEIMQDFFDTNNIQTDLYYDAASGRFRFYFNDPGNRVTRGCIKLYRENTNGRSALSNICSSGASGIIYAPFTARNETTYIAHGFIYIGGDERLVEVESKRFISTPTFGADAWFYVFLLSTLFALTAVFSIPIAVALTPIPLVIFANIGWVNVEPSIAFGIWGVAIVLSMILGRGGSHG